MTGSLDLKLKLGVIFRYHLIDSEPEGLRVFPAPPNAALKQKRILRLTCPAKASYARTWKFTRRGT